MVTLIDLKKKKQQELDALRDQYKDFKQSPLHIPGCMHIVFGEGNPDARLVFIGEAPGKNEDEQGRPFVGRSGKLLDKMLHAAGISRNDIYITNIVKCRPPHNRTPKADELKLGKELLLEKELQIIKPKVICTLGTSALVGLTGASHALSKIRGHPIIYNDMLLLPTFHPAYALRSKRFENALQEDIIKAVELSQKHN